MSCPTCDHTMQSIEYGLFWCPRCGTLKNDVTVEGVPMLVPRVRSMLSNLPVGRSACAMLGIVEAVFKPEDRGGDTPRDGK